jgi:hypothetical protein
LSKINWAVFCQGPLLNVSCERKSVSKTQQLLIFLDACVSNLQNDAT